MIFVIGWVRSKPGKREELLKVAAPVLAITRKEDGCLFYELHPTAADPDLTILVEGWQSRAQHRAHQQAPHHVAFGSDFQRLAAEGRFEEIEAAGVNTVNVKF
jgi:quinol monooxygenase YgiN